MTTKLMTYLALFYRGGLRIEFASKLVIKMQYMMKHYIEVAIGVASKQCIHFLFFSAMASQPLSICTWLCPQEMASQVVGESACYKWHSYARGYHKFKVFG